MNPKQQPTTDAEVTDDTLTDEQIAERITKKFDAVFQSDSESSDADADGDVADDEEDSSESVEDAGDENGEDDAGKDSEDGEDGEDEKDGEDDVDEDEDDEPEAAAAQAPTLPDAVRRSLLANGWKDDEIDDQLTEAGAAFVKAAEKIHEKRNAETARWADLGRQQRQANQSPASTPQQSTESKTPSDLLKALTEQKVDLDALKKKYGEDELIDELGGRLNSLTDVIAKLVPQAQQIEQAAASSQDVAQQQLVRQVETFFDERTTEGFDAFYGDHKKAMLTQEQADRRNAVVEYADALVSGATALGRQISVPEALITAHDHVAAEFTEQRARDSVRKEVKKRSDGRSLKPGSRREAKRKKTGFDEAAFEQRVSRRMEKVFGVPNS